MTKVECPGPGFKGLKWKWIQDHAKEQQEREKKQPSGQPPAQEQSPAPAPLPDSRPLGSSTSGQAAGSHSDAQATVHPEPRNGVPCSTTGVAVGLQSGPALQPPIKVELGHGPPGPGPGPAIPPAAPVFQPDVELRRRVKGEEAPKANGAEPVAQPANGRSTFAGLHSAAPHTLGPVAGSVAEPTAAGRAATSLAGPGPTSAAPSTLATTSSLPGRKSLDSSAVLSAAKAVPVVASPSPPPGQLQVAPTLSAPVVGLAPVALPTSASAPALHQMAAATAAAAAAAPAPQPTAAGQPPTVTVGPPAPVAPPAAGPVPLSARARLPPSRAPSITVAAAAVKGGDDFESMFTPLSSLPAVGKSETPMGAGGGVSRAGSLALGAQASVPHAGAAGSGAAGSAADSGAAAADRKVPPKKASRLAEAKPGSGPEQPDADHVHAGRSRTPVGAQGGPGSAASGKDAVTSAAGGSCPSASRAQQQPQGLHGLLTQQQTQSQPQRASGLKQPARDSKDASKAREPADAADPNGAAAPTAGARPQPAAAAAGASAAAAPSGRSAGCDKDVGRLSGAPAADAPSGSGLAAGDKGERKRPRSDGSKPKAIPPTTPTDIDFGAPYVETLADRIKRARRATTSSSEHDGAPSHGGSGERVPGSAGATATGGAGRGQEGRPRPATSAEAQSRGVDAAHGNTFVHAAVHAATTSGATAAATPGDSPAAGTGAVGSQPPGAKQQQRSHPPGRGDDAAGAPSSGPRSGTPAQDKVTEQPLVAGGATHRTSLGGAVTDSSGGGSAPSARERASAAPGPGTTPAGQGAARPAAAGSKRPADFPPARRPGAPAAKLPRSDPALPRPLGPHGAEARGNTGAAAAEGAAVGASGSKPPGSLLPPSGKPGHRSGGSAPTGSKAPGKQGTGDGRAPLSAAAGGPGLGPSPTPPHPRFGRLGDADMPAAGSCKGPAGGSRNSKDGAGGPRGGGAAGGGGPGAAATTTTEPKTDSDTRTSRVVECYFRFDESPCHAGGGSAAVSGLGSSGSLQGALRLGGVSHGGSGALRGCATVPPQHLDLGKVRSFKELWIQLAALYDGTLPDEMDLKIIYLDEEGDWIMVTPDEPWSSVAAAATKVLVTNRA